MTNKLYVYADWKGLNEPELIGALRYENNGSYGFCFSNKWLAKHNDITLSADLHQWEGWQFSGNDGVFRMFQDVMPDRWGTLLMNRRELISAEQEHRMPRRLSSFDFLSQIHDPGRMGGLRFKIDPKGDFINYDSELSTPPFYRLRELLAASEELEKSELKNELVDEKWLQQLVAPGSSLGGARPKANILDEQGKLCIAKFPSHSETEDTELWEHFSHIMAEKCGISAAQTRIIDTGRFHTLLSKRFDRDENGNRIHYASAITLLGLQDGDNAKSGHGYLDIADFLMSNSNDTMSQIRQLYRRIAFNICIGNRDDHFRNHGFLLKDGKWEMSPAFDLNPTNEKEQALLISKNSSKADLNILLDSSEDYMMRKDEALGIIKEVQNGLHGWREEANRLQIPMLEQKRFERRFDEYASLDLNADNGIRFHR